MVFSLGIQTYQTLRWLCSVSWHLLDFPTQNGCIFPGLQGPHSWKTDQLGQHQTSSQASWRRRKMSSPFSTASTGWPGQDSTGPAPLACVSSFQLWLFSGSSGFYSPLPLSHCEIIANVLYFTQLNSEKPYFLTHVTYLSCNFLFTSHICAYTSVTAS